MQTAVQGLPVLIKFIDARENLSIQVLPDDERPEIRQPVYYSICSVI